MLFTEAVCNLFGNKNKTIGLAQRIAEKTAAALSHNFPGEQVREPEPFDDLPDNFIY
jgi:hypothetical protein